jgi:hypothetical protein
MNPLQRLKERDKRAISIHFPTIFAAYSLSLVKISEFQQAKMTKGALVLFSESRTEIKRTSAAALFANLLFLRYSIKRLAHSIDVKYHEYTVNRIIV